MEESREEIRIYEDFTSFEECDLYNRYLDKALELQRMKPLTVKDPKVRELELQNPRLVVDAYQIEDEEFVSTYRKHLDSAIELIGHSRKLYAHKDNCLFNYYPVNGHLIPHRDDHQMPDCFVTSVLYLDEPENYDGGELYFPNLDLVLKPKKGTLLIFPGTYWHEARKVTSGFKRTLALNYTEDESVKY